MSMARSRGLRIGFIALVIVGLLAALRPWTIEPIQTAAPAAFDPPSYVASSWPRVLREADETAVRRARPPVQRECHPIRCTGRKGLK